MSKRTVSFVLLIVTAILLLGGGLTVIGFFIWTNVDGETEDGEEDPNLHLEDDVCKKEYSLFDDYNSDPQVQDDEPQIIEISLDEEGEEYYLGEEGIELLIEKIQTDLGYGPEIFMLDSITIGHNYMMDESSNGVYFSTTNEIFINTYNFETLYPFVEDENLANNVETKVEMIFEIIFHEYNHHLAYVYLNSLTNDDPNNTKTNDNPEDDIFIAFFKEDGKIDWVEESWNSHFVENFKAILNYDTDTDLFLPIQNPSEEVSYFYILAQYLNQKDLFELVNYQAVMTTEDQDTLERMFGDDYEKMLEEVYYLYSMDELFARKYQQLNQTYNVYTADNNIKYDEDGYIIKKGIELKASDLAQNTFFYQTTFNLEYDRNDNLITDRYLYDAPFDNEEFTDGEVQSDPEGLYYLMDAHMGHIDSYPYVNDGNEVNGADISLVWRPNDAHLTESENDDLLMSYQVGGDDTNSDLIKIGGYVDEDPDHGQVVQIAFGDTDDLLCYDVFVNSYTYKRKDSLSSSKHVALEEEVEEYFFVTEDWVDAGEVEGDVIYFIYEDDAEIPIKSTREGEYGYPSTYGPDLPFFLQEGPTGKFLEYYVEKDNMSNQVVIQSHYIN